MNSATLLSQCSLSYRQLDYACRQGWLKPDNPHGKGTDNGREWTNGEVRVVKLASRLTEIGFPLKRAIEIARCVPAEVNGYYQLYLGKGISIHVAEK